MKALLLVAVAALLSGSAAAAGFDEALRASGLTPLTKQSRLTPQERTPDWDGSFSSALWLREEKFVDDERSECGGQAGCGQQVAPGWLARRQGAAVSRAAEETLLRRYGLRGWSRSMMAQGSDDAAHLSLAAAVGAVLLYADGVHYRTTVSGVRLALDLVPGRRLQRDRGDIAKLELGAAGRPLSFTAAVGRHAPSLGANYRLRY